MSNKTSIVVLAAGLGTRFKGGIKQLASVGPNGELLMEYSVRDAVDAGFGKVIFIIRKDIEEQFRQLIGNKIEEIADVRYCFQDNGVLPGGFSVPEGRTKPWGTVHAVLAAESDIDEPFAIINADDYYGKKSYKIVRDYLVSADRAAGDQCMAGFILKNTLSRTGAVTRGVCHADSEGFLETVHETYNIKTEDDGIIYGDYNGSRISLDENCIVSMNMWGFDKDYCGLLGEQFEKFLETQSSSLTAEYPLPFAVDGNIRENKCRVKVLPTDEKWYGMTYIEDIEEVKAELSAMRK